MSIQERAMLVSLNVKKWTARKLDRKVTREVAENHNTTVDAGRYNKQLIAKDPDGTLTKIHKAMGDLRNWHYTQTLPWLSSGERILPAANYWDYTNEYDNKKRQIEYMIDQFVTEYPLLVDKARTYLNGLFDEKDYPDPAVIRGKFLIDVAFTPIPTAQDWRIELTESEEQAIKTRIEETAQNAMDNAMDDLWQRLYNVVDHIRERLSDPDKKFKDSLIHNANELCDLLPRLNVGDDPALEAMTEEVRKVFQNVQPSDLRETGKNAGWRVDRAAHASQAAQLADTIAGYM